MAGEERKAEREVGAGEDGEGLDEDVGDSLVLGEVRVELVSRTPLSATGTRFVLYQVVAVDGFQIELIIELQWAE